MDFYFEIERISHSDSPELATFTVGEQICNFLAFGRNVAREAMELVEKGRLTGYIVLKVTC